MITWTRARDGRQLTGTYVGPVTVDGSEGHLVTTGHRSMTLLIPAVADPLVPARISVEVASSMTPPPDEDGGDGEGDGGDGGPD